MGVELMGYGDLKCDETLKAAWESFCEDLKRAGGACFQDVARTTPPERAEAFRYLTQSIALGFEFFLENRDPQYPYLMRYFWPTRKQAGDNANALYYGAWIDGNETYRIVGNRGSAKWLIFSVLRPAGEADSSVSGSWERMGLPYNLVNDAEPLIAEELECEWDGSFVLWLSPEPHSGNWMKTSPRSCKLRIRQFFDDWENEESAKIRIERVGGEPGSGAPPLITPERMAEALAEIGRFAITSTEFWPTGLGPWKPPSDSRWVRPEPNESWIGRPDGNPRGVGAKNMAAWDLDPDEALIVQFTPGPARMWTLELYNVWCATPDYRWRLASLSSAQAALEEDGRVLCVLAHEDPGVPNWLDVGGWTEGWMPYRGVLSDEGPEFQLRKVKLANLENELPSGTPRITPEERKEQIRRRANGIERRFRN